MKKFTTLTAVAAPIDIVNCDTDRILCSTSRPIATHRS